MRSVLCYGDSNTWGYEPGTEARLGPDVRWPGVLRSLLGPGTLVVEEGLSGRTTAFDVPWTPYRNGLAHLPVALESHAPLDAVIIFLGTNDLFLPQRVGPLGAARGTGALVELALASGAGPDGAAPAVLAVVPPPFAPVADADPDYPDAVAGSDGLSEAYRHMAQEQGCALLDLRGVATSSPVDGIHFDGEQHRAIAGAVADALRALEETA